jgi:hypothetical protein
MHPWSLLVFVLVYSGEYDILMLFWVSAPGRVKNQVRQADFQPAWHGHSEYNMNISHGHVYMCVVYSTFDLISSAVARQCRHGLCALQLSLNPPNNCAPRLSADVYAKDPHKFCSVPLTVKQWPVSLQEVKAQRLSQYLVREENRRTRSSIHQTLCQLNKRHWQTLKYM